jgi:hypothetical protein
VVGGIDRIIRNHWRTLAENLSIPNHAIIDRRSQVKEIKLKAHELINVLNHCDPQSEWDGGDILTAPDGVKISIMESAKTMTPGHSALMPPREGGSQQTFT